MHPIAISAAVPIPYSSAPIIAAITISRPVLNPPSVRKVIRSLRLFIERTWCASVKPISQGNPANLIEVAGDAPVPPLWPDIRITSASALATPAAIVPTPDDATNFTVTLHLGLICFKS